MGKRSLAFKHKNVVVLVLQHEFLHRTVDEVSHHRIDRTAITLNHDSGLPCGNKLGIAAPLLKGPGNFNRNHLFTYTTVLANGLNSQAIRTNPNTVCNLVFIILANVVDDDSKLFGRGNQFRIFRNKVVKS